MPSDTTGREHSETELPEKNHASHSSSSGNEAFVPMQDEPRESKELFRKIFENGKFGIILTGADGKFLKVNPAFCSMTGFTEKELLTKRFSDITHPENVPADTGSLPKLISGEISSYHTEKRYIRKDRKEIWVDLLVSVIRDANGSFEYFLGMVEDISDRKRAEAERGDFLRFFQISADIMVIADPNGAFKKVNPACLQILGYAEEELLAKPFIDFVHPDDKQSTLDEMARQTKIGSSLDFENRYMRKDGTPLWLSWRATYDKNDGITYATARDITDRKESEKKNREHVEEIENINKLMVGRELKMMELKNEIEELKKNKASPQ